MLAMEYALAYSFSNHKRSLMKRLNSAVREFCVNQCCTVMHCTAIKGIGRPGNSLIIKAQELNIAD